MSRNDAECYELKKYKGDAESVFNRLLFRIATSVSEFYVMNRFEFKRSIWILSINESCIKTMDDKNICERLVCFVRTTELHYTIFGAMAMGKGSSNASGCIYEFVQW